ncbi:MAG: hypothetical protein RLZZ272_1202 [Actinomycetota bacterium]|jgi:rod shape-determining protein MreD
MMRRTLLIALVLLAALLLQTSLLPAVAIAGFRPDLLLMVTAIVALRDGALPGLRVGAVAGLLTDLLLSESHLGLSVVTHVGIAHVLVLVRPYLTTSSPFLGPAVGFTTAFVGTLVHGILSILLADSLAGAATLIVSAVALGIWATLLWPLVDSALGRLLEAVPADVPAEAG